MTGKHYGAALEEMITKPLGLKDTAYDDERAVVPRRAKDYDLRDDKLANPPPLSVSVAHGAGAMRSTAADMLRWQDALFSGKVVKPENFILMIEPPKLKDGRLTSVTAVLRDKAGNRKAATLTLARADRGAETPVVSVAFGNTPAVVLPAKSSV